MRKSETRLVNYPTTLSADGSTYAYGLSNESASGYSILVNEVPGPEFKRVGTPALSRDGKTVAYKASRNGSDWLIVSNGHETGPVFEALTDPAVSDDGQVVAFAGDDEKSVLFVGERRIAIDRLPFRVFLSKDGSAWGLVDKHVVTTSQGRSESFDEIRGGEFSPTGNRVVFSGRTGEKWFIVVAGRKIEASGLISDPVWSKDGSRIGFGVQIGRELWWKTIKAE